MGPAPRITRILRLVRSGALEELAVRTHTWARRRRYRLLARLQGIRVQLEVVDPPQSLIAGCLYKLEVRVRNASRIAWNTSARRPTFCAALSLHLPNGAVVEGRHRALPRDFRPGSVAAMHLFIDVPQCVCEARLRLDLVRESCFWFSEIGRPPAEVRVRLIDHDDTQMRERPPALDVTLDITNRCPLRCIQCRKTVAESPDDQGEMPLELYRSIAADLLPRAQSVMLSSAGEPLMAPYLEEALQVARSHGVIELAFNTSGMLLTRRRAETLVDLGVDRIEFSVDGASAEVYNAIRVRSSFDRVVENITYLSSLKERLHRRLPLIRLNFVLMKRNVHELPDLIDLAVRVGAEEVQCQHLVIFTPALRDEALIFERERCNRAIEEARRRAASRGVRFYHPPLFRVETATSVGTTPPDGNGQVSGATDRIARADIWESEPQVASFSRKSHSGAAGGMPVCTDPWRKVYLDWQGLVFPCCVWKEEPLGDLRRSTFDAIWNSDRYRQLRTGLLTGTLGRSCSQCSAITGGDVNDARSYLFLSPEG